MNDDAFVGNAADPKQVREAAEKEKFGRDLELDDIRWILSDARGRRQYWRILEFCGMNKTSFTGNSTTFFNEGMRNVGLKLQADMMDARPEAFIQMINEAKAEKLKKGNKNDNRK